MGGLVTEACLHMAAMRQQRHLHACGRQDVQVVYYLLLQHASFNGFSMLKAVAGMNGRLRWEAGWFLHHAEPVPVWSKSRYRSIGWCDRMGE